jgi:hypothetical protein
VVGAPDVDEELVAAAVVDDVKTAVVVVVVLELLMIQVASAREMKKMQDTDTMKNNLTQKKDRTTRIESKK